MLIRLFTSVTRRPAIRKWVWRHWYQYLARRYPDPSWRFMNYGFSPDPGSSRLPLDASDEAERSWILLYHHVASAVDLAGRHVLEVGCGRGGGASFVRRALAPKAMVGLDRSENAVAFCRRHHRVGGLTFRAGDAERIPFDDSRFDAVVNVESSHCYGSMDRFVSEVFRVLRPGGHFLYADFRPRSAVDAWLSQLASSGFVEKRRIDITGNVLRAIEQENEQRLELIERNVPKPMRAVFRQFAAVPGSALYEEFRTGDTIYWSFVMQKPESEAVTSQ